MRILHFHHYSKRKLLISLFIFVILFFSSLFFVFTAQGVTRTWDGGGADNNWNTPANWSGDTVPTSSDTAVFDSTSTKNCTINVTLSGGTAPAGLSINTGYTGTITQASGVSVTIGSSGFSQAVGTFTGGDSAITINGTYTLSGGTFTSTSGTMTISNNFTHTAGGTFNHNSGTVNFSFGAITLTVDVATSETFNNLTIICTDNYTLAIASGDTLIVLGTLTHTEGVINTGTIEARGNVSIASTADGGSGTISFLTSGDQTITGNSGSTCRLNIAKSSGTVSMGSTNLSITGLTLSSGTLTSTSGTLTITTNSAGTQSFTHTAGGTFNHNSGTVTFSNGFLSAIPIDVATSETFYNLTISMVDNYPVNIASGDSLIVLGTFTYTDGRVETGTVEARGNVVVASTADGGSSLLSFTGTSDQTYTDQGGNEPNGNVTINKPVGTKVTLASNADWNAASQAVTITSGILDIASYNLYTGGTLTVGANGVLHDYSTGDLILGGNVSNSGIIRLESSGSCGSTDAISITSSSGGVQRTWSGSGVYTLWDTSIQDQGGTAKIQVNSGTSVSGNGTNFVFNSACNFANNTSSLTSGLVGYWPMEENSGTSTADMSGQGNNGTLTNGPTWTTGQIGRGVNLNGTNQYVSVGASAALNNLGPMTLVAWINPTTESGFRTILDKQSNGNGWTFGLCPSGNSSVCASTKKIYFQQSFNTHAIQATWTSAPSSLNYGQWQQVVVVYDKSSTANDPIFYINGVVSATTETTSPSGTADSDSFATLGIGADGAVLTPLYGQMDEVRIYNRALSATEVQQLYNNVRPSAVSIPSSKITIPSGKVNFAY